MMAHMALAIFGQRDRDPRINPSGFFGFEFGSLLGMGLGFEGMNFGAEMFGVGMGRAADPYPSNGAGGQKGGSQSDEPHEPTNPDQRQQYEDDPYGSPLGSWQGQTGPGDPPRPIIDPDLTGGGPGHPGPVTWLQQFLLGRSWY